MELKIKTNRRKQADSQFKASILAGGDMGNMIRSKDWSSTTLGDLQTWPECLRISLNIMLNTSVPMCIWWGKEELISFYNDAFKDTLRNKQSDALGQSADVLLPDLWDTLGPLACNVFETGKPVHRENVMYIVKSKASKKERYLNFAYSPIFDSVGSVEGLLCTIADTTSQALRQQELDDSEQRFRALADNIPNLAWMAKADGYIYWYNSRWYEYTGTSPKEMEGWGWQSVHDPAYLPKVIAKWKRSIKSSKTFEMVFPIKGSDAVFRPFLTRVVPVRSPEGKIIQWIGTNTDITQQVKIKQTEAENERLEEFTRQLAAQRQELIEINRAKEEFISLASHQLRTPATGVKQYLGMLLGGYVGELTPVQKELAEKSYESNEREITIINDLLQVAQVDAGKMKLLKKKVNFVTLISEILDEQKSNFADRQQKIVYRHNESKIMTNADRDRLRMVLENLIDNASKYTGPQTTITVTLTKLKDRQGIQIKIKDEGVGIPKEHISKIFDKFVRIDNARSIAVGGSGLGLYLVKKIVDLHDGVIKVTSTPSKGTTFTLSLPSASATTEPTRY